MYESDKAFSNDPKIFEKQVELAKNKLKRLRVQYRVEDLRKIYATMTPDDKRAYGIIVEILTEYNRRQQPPPGVSGWWKSEEATSKRDSLIKSQAVLEKQIKDEENSIGALNRYRMINERSNPEDVKDIPEQIQGMRKNIAQWRADKKRIQREISSVKWEPVRI